MRGSTLPFAPTKTYGPISVDLREKQKKKKISPFLSSRSNSLRNPLCRFVFILFLFFAMCPSGSFYPETIYLFYVQFILNELSSIHFLTSKIFVKISSLESWRLISQKLVKKFQLFQNSTKFFWVTRFRETNLTAQFISSFEI